MIDARSDDQFAKIKANRDRTTLKIEIFDNFPVLERQVQTQINTWIASVHKLGSWILFGTADEMSIPIDTSFGFKKDKATIRVTGEFVSLILSATTSLSQARLTIFARRNGFCCLSIADDLRQQAEITSIVGLAIMLPLPVTYGNIYDECQLVVLDTLVHSSQHFVVIKPIKVSFERDLFMSCALISESKALVFTRDIIISISLTKLTQKRISYPQGISCISYSLNALMNVPYMIVVTDKFDKQIE